LEVGRYQDPYNDYGRLENEMWRAIRLVVDTGVHEKHWSRDQMVAYFHRYTAARRWTPRAMDRWARHLQSYQYHFLLYSAGDFG
jgi:uncharacterized protein (DUF885 family)